MRCPTCRGKGKWYGPKGWGLDPNELVWHDCDTCGKTGRVYPQAGGEPAGGGGCGGWIANVVAGLIARAVLAVIVVVLVGAVIFGFSWWKSRNHGLVEARPSSEVTTEGYAIGSCLNDPFGAAIPVDCATPHDGEVYRILEAKDPKSEAYPGNGRLDDFAGAICPDHFEAYVGGPLRGSDLSIGSRSPTETEWRIGSRRVLCFAGGGSQGTITGTIAGSGGRSGG